MTLVFLAVLGAGVVGFVLYPVFAREASPTDPAPEQASELDRLAEEKVRVLASIKDLDFEYNSGKLSDADYQRIRAEDLARAAGIMSRMEALTPGGDKKVSDGDREVEAGVTCSSCQQNNPEGATFCLRCGNRFETSVKCPTCGTELPGEARFCISCGEAIRT
jgi:hypothetical protein